MGAHSSFDESIISNRDVWEVELGQFRWNLNACTSAMGAILSAQRSPGRDRSALISKDVEILLAPISPALAELQGRQVE